MLHVDIIKEQSVCPFFLSFFVERGGGSQDLTNPFKVFIFQIHVVYRELRKSAFR